MKEERWLRIIPVALIMYTISYVDRTNITLALDKDISTMVHDLAMDDRMRGLGMGIFFWGYPLLQMPGGYLASRWSAKKFISLCLIFWGACAIGCGLARTFHQFAAMRFLLGMAESGVLPATTVLLANWFPRAELARANGYWNLCQPLAVVTSAPITGKLLGWFDWHTVLIMEGALPFLFLPLWWYFISDHPREATWISSDEKEFLETTLKKEIASVQPIGKPAILPTFLKLEIPVMVVIYFLHNFQAYGCMTFFTDTLKGRAKEQNFSGFESGILFAIPYALTAIIMILVSRHSDKKQERRGHCALVYGMSGVSLIASLLLKQHFWISYAFLCFAIPGPFAAIAPFWAITAETMPRYTMGLVIGLVNAIGNIGGFAGPYLTGWLSKKTGGITLPFAMLAVGMLVAAGLCFLLPKAKMEPEVSTLAVPNASVQ
ncbi:MAG TPA: MFS transporter [Verrucomicrobiae bacterium]|nr:MFS transporter [Verrucomicrobiae bacterium]